jgi:ABC-type glutathione transport system ATPase component
MARVSVEGIARWVLDGEFFCIIGPSGCGKTILLRILAGLEKPDQGAIFFDGEDVTRTSPGTRDVAMVFQSYALYPHLRARGNIGFPLQITRMHADEVDRRVVHTAEDLGSNLVSMLDYRPGGRASTCSTSHCRTSMPRSRPRPVRTCAASCAGSAAPSSTSHRTTARRSRSATGSR